MKVYIPMKDGEVLYNDVVKGIIANHLDICPITSQGNREYSELNRINNLLRAINCVQNRSDDLLFMDSDVVLPNNIIDMVFDDKANLNKDIITLKSNRGSHILVYIKKRSINKFKNFLEDIEEETGRDYCPLCEFFNTNENIMIDSECYEISKPIGKFTNIRIQDKGVSAPVSIPKIIHYCWFGSKSMSPLNKQCIDSWKTKCPEYKIIEWNEDNFNVNFDDISQLLYKTGNMARFTNYVRLCVLYKFGGFYLDTDMELLKPLDDFLKEKFFLGYQDDADSIINNSIIGSVLENPLVLDIINNYTRSKCQELGGVIISEVLKRKSIFDYKIFGHNYFSPMAWDAQKMPNRKEAELIRDNINAYAFHWYEGTWMNPNTASYWDNKLSKFSSFWRNEHYKFILDLLPKKEYSLLDVGCALGNGCQLIKNHSMQAQITGIDLSNVAIEKAINHSDNITYKKLDILVDKINGEYDYITLIQTLEHFDDPFFIIDKLLKNVKQKIIITTPYTKGYTGSINNHEHRFAFNEKTFSNRYNCNVVGIKNISNYECIIYEIKK